MAYAGRQPTTGFRSTPTKDSFNGDNSTTEFTLSISTRTNDVEVFVENVQQEPVTAYSISGNTLTFTSAPPTGTGNIYVIHRAELVSNGVHTPGANLDAGETTLDTLAVDTNTLVVDADNNRVGIGTDSPAQLLELSSTAPVLRWTETDTSSYSEIAHSLGDLFISADRDGTSSGDMIFRTDGGTERMRIDSSGNVGIGTTTMDAHLNVNSGNDNLTLHLESTDASCNLTQADNSGSTNIASNGGNLIIITGGSGGTPATGGSEAMRIDSSGDLIIGSTSDTGTNYHYFQEDGFVRHVRDDSVIMVLDRKNSVGDIATFRKDGLTVGSIGSVGDDIFIDGEGSNGSGIRFESNQLRPRSNGSDADNTVDLGGASFRFDDIFATNGTIQTSDRNEKQDIATLTTAEMAVAARLSNQFKTFRWIDSVTEKGDNARTHAGIIAQDVQQAFTDEGLDAGDYAMFISSTWWETQTEVPAVEAVDEVLDEDGNVVTEAVEAQEAYTRTDTYDTAEEAPEGATERTRMGIRYPELLSFMQAYNDQRMASIEARLDALEAN